MNKLIAALLILGSVLAAPPAWAKPPAPFLPWWYQAPPTIPSYYYSQQCAVAYWYVVQHTTVNEFGLTVTWLTYEPYWVCS